MSTTIEIVCMRPFNQTKCASKELSATFLLIALIAAQAASFATQTAERTISFPDDVSYGTLIDLGSSWKSTERHPKGRFVAAAKGTVKCSSDATLMFVASLPLVEHPSMLNKLAPDSFQFIDFSNLPVDDNIFVPLTRLSGLRRLDFEEGKFSDKSFASLSRLTNLEVLSVRQCQINGKSLTQFGSLKRLQMLILNSVNLDWKLLSTAAPEMPALTDLVLTFTNVTDDGLRWLERMPSLTFVHLESNSRITDRGLLQLCKLKHLNRLFLKRLKVTPRGLLQLKASSVRSMQIIDAHFTPEEMKRIKNGLPHVAITFEDQP